MDELEFRRRIYADPNTTDSDLVAAANADEKKRAFLVLLPIPNLPDCDYLNPLTF